MKKKRIFEVYMFGVKRFLRFTGFLFSILLGITASYGQKSNLCLPGPLANGMASYTLTDSAVLPGAQCNGGLLNFTALLNTPINSSINYFGTTHYGVDTIPYTFLNFTNFFLHIPPNYWSQKIALPFSFCYFGQKYDTITLSSYGMVSFNKALAGTLTSTFISNTVGLPSSQYPTNTIFAYHPQLNYDSAQLANNILQYAVIGFAPCRKFIISWEAINIAGGACSGKTAFFQIILHESNVIDLQMAYLSKCGVPATRLFGIQDANGFNAFSVAGFNTGNDSVLGRAWRFYPDVVDNLSHLAILSDNGVAIDSVIPSIQGTQFLAQFNNVLLQYPPSQHLYSTNIQTFHTAAVCQPNPTITGPATLSLHQSAAINAQLDGDSSWCGNALYSGTIFASTTSSSVQKVSWYLNGALYSCCNPSLMTLSNVTQSNDTWVVKMTDSNGCSNNDTFHVKGLIGPASIVSKTINPATCATNGLGSVQLTTAISPNNYPITCKWYLQNGTFVQNGNLLNNVAPGVYYAALSYSTVSCNGPGSYSTNYCEDTFHFNIPDLRLIVTTSQSISICNGTNYTIGSNSYATAGTYKDTLLNQFGCDSIVTTVLSLKPKSTMVQLVNLCSGKQIQVGVHSYSSAGNFQDTLINQSGCDSIISTTIKLLSSSSGQFSTTICKGQQVLFNGINRTLSGDYLDTLVNYQGCDSILTLHLTVNASVPQTNNVKICKGNSLVVGLHQYTLSGNYADTLTSFLGCDSIINTYLTVIAPSVQLTSSPDTLFQVGELITINAQFGNANDSVLLWWPSNIITVQSANTATTSPTQNTYIGVQTITTEGCIATDSIWLHAINIAIPNGFTPNEDNQNDVFLVRGSALNQVKEISIFNRWGERVFHTTNALEGWDGKYKGQYAELGTYQYSINVLVNESKSKLIKGNVQLIR